MFHCLFVADAAAPGVDPNLQQTLIMVGLAIVFFYFILWRPEQKRRKALEAKKQLMKKGDKVFVAGGIVAEVYSIQKETIIVKLFDGAKMEVVKGAIQDFQESPAPVEKVEE